MLGDYFGETRTCSPRVTLQLLRLGRLTFVPIPRETRYSGGAVLTEGKRINVGWREKTVDRHATNETLRRSVQRACRACRCTSAVVHAHSLSLSLSLSSRENARPPRSSARLAISIASREYLCPLSSHNFASYTLRMVLCTARRINCVIRGSVSMSGVRCSVGTRLSLPNGCMVEAHGHGQLDARR